MVAPTTHPLPASQVPDRPSLGVPASEAPTLPALSPADTALLFRLFALNENFPALAAELQSTASDRALADRLSAQTVASHASAASPPMPDAQCLMPTDLLSLYFWASGHSIAPWIAFHRHATDNQRRSLSLNTLEEIAKSSPAPTERRRAASTILRALDGRWSRSPSSPVSRIPSPVSRPCPPPPISRPNPGADQHAELKLIREAFQAPQASVALSTLHEHAAHPAANTAPAASPSGPCSPTFAAHPIHPDKAEWVAATPGILPAGFRFPLWLSGCKETEYTESPEGSLSRWILWAANTDKTSFRCSLTLRRGPVRPEDANAVNPDRQGGARDAPPHPPDNAWRLATFDILSRSD